MLSKEQVEALTVTVAPNAPAKAAAQQQQMQAYAQQMSTQGIIAVQGTDPQASGMHHFAAQGLAGQQQLAANPAANDGSPAAVAGVKPPGA